MRTAVLFVFAALCLMYSSVAGAKAQEEEVLSVQELVAEIYRAEPAHFTWKRMADAPFGRGFEVVLVSPEGRRYTIDHEWWVGGFEIYERPDGTGGMASLDCYRDINLDGLIDYGTDGMCERVPLRPYDPLDPSTEFPERQQWQQRYERALTALRTTLEEDERVVATAEL